MYKLVHYGLLGEIVRIDGKFSCAVIESFDAQGFNDTLVYFVKDDTLHVAKVFHDFISEEEDRMREGRVQEVLDGCDYTYVQCSTEEFIMDFKTLLYNQKRTKIEAGSGNIVLTHYLDTNNMYVHKETLESMSEALQFKDSQFSYGTIQGLMFEGYPDFEDSSTAMNFMLSGGNVEDLKKCTSVFEEYTKRMDIQY